MIGTIRLDQQDRKELILNVVEDGILLLEVDHKGISLIRDGEAVWSKDYTDDETEPDVEP